MKLKSIDSTEVLLFAIFARDAILEDLTTSDSVAAAYNPTKDFLRFCGECFARELLLRINSKTSPETVDVRGKICHDDACSQEVS